VAALGGFFIRTGNLMNSEIYGKPSGSNYGFVFARDFTHLLTYGDDDRFIKKVYFVKAEDDSVKVANAVPLDLKIVLSNKIKTEAAADDFTRKVLSFALYKRDYQSNIVHPDIGGLTINREKSDRNFIMTARVYGIPRHPTQFYEGGANLLIFFILLGIYLKYHASLRDGFILGAFFFLIFGARFFIEFVKENQEAFEESLKLNMGQILSLPFALLGIVIMILRWPKKEIR
jgi:prolipoprotein diacylglyceryltransferase